MILLGPENSSLGLKSLLHRLLSVILQSFYWLRAFAKRHWKDFRSVELSRLPM